MDSSIPPYEINGRVNEIEYALGRTYLESLPRYMTIVLGNGCNIDCKHCYQLKNGDNLLRNPEIGAALRREFLSIYPFLKTLRIQGGEVFALKGFKDLLDDISSCVDKPLVSISTNATLMSEEWCQRMIDTPFQTVTISLDGGTPTTYERIRIGAKFDDVIRNIKCLQRLKREQDSWYPNLDAFFVIMKSNFREIPDLLRLLESLEIYEVTFQMLLLDERNLSRSPELEQERICEEDDVKALYDIVQETELVFSGSFDRIAWSGLKSLFDHWGLDTSFLNEGEKSLYPAQKFEKRYRGGSRQPIAPAIELPSLPEGYGEYKSPSRQCPNPWTTLFITENGDVSLCFLADPIGNLYQKPLREIWNSHEAVSKRGRLLVGRYTDSGCSSLYCDWRDGKVCDPPDTAGWKELLQLFQQLIEKLNTYDEAEMNVPIPENLRAIRRLISLKDSRIQELEANLSYLWETNGVLHQKGQRYIDELEKKIQVLEEQVRSMR